ncbi:MAG: hypothetical protein QOJ42_6198 [Acidobacteriaceae bacterium]|nr:hypothetical protein [Acidobacteriaceae bacterium]
MNDLPDQQPVGTIKNVSLEHAGGNRVVEDIGGGRYIFYAHLSPGTIPTGVREGTRLSPGDLIGRVANSGGSEVPHLHFQLADSPDGATAAPLPFVFTSQMLEGRASEDQVERFLKGNPAAIDRTGAGVRRDQMPARNDVFGYNPSR